MNQMSTTELEVIRREPKHFTWGEVVTITDVGAYTFVEFLPFVMHPREQRVSESDSQWYTYVNGKDLGASANNLEGAMVIAIANHNLDRPEAHWMAAAVCKLLGIAT